MDGFNVIPVDKDQNASGPGVSSVLPKQPSFGDSSFEIVDEAKQAEQKKQAESGGWIFVLAIIFLLSAFGYFGFLVFQRESMLSSIGAYGNEMRTVGQNIDKNEMKEFQNMDTTLSTINSRLQKHILNYQIMQLVNSNIRSSLQVSEYRLDVKEREIEVSISAAAPSFKDLAEQTERFFQMREGNIITAFTVSNLSFDQETRKMRFSMRLIFDKAKMNAAAQNTPIPVSNIIEQTEATVPTEIPSTGN